MTVAATRAPRSSRTEIIAFRQVERFFEPSTFALRSVTFSIDEGETVALVGRSGSGKSTLLAILGLMDRPTAGEYELFGRAASTLNDAERTRLRREKLGFVFQAFHLVPHLTALENVQYALDIAGAGRSAARRQASEALSAVGLAHRASSLPSQLSGGEQQRVAIARAVVRRPALLLCDEPTGNLDSANSEHVLEILLSEAGMFATVVIITHDPGVANACGRQLQVVDGSVRPAA